MMERLYYSILSVQPDILKPISMFLQINIIYIGYPYLQEGFLKLTLQCLFPKPITVNPISICTGSEGRSCFYRTMRFTLRGTSGVLGEREGVHMWKRSCESVFFFVRMFSLCMHACTVEHSSDLSPHFPALAPHHYGNLTDSIWTLPLLLHFRSKWWNQCMLHLAFWILSSLLLLEAASMCTFSLLFLSFCSDRFTAYHSWCYYGERLSVPFSEKPLHFVWRWLLVLDEVSVVQLNNNSS